MVFVHLLLFILAAGIIWALSGMLISATDRVARRYNRPGFAVAFFLLGMLTSVSEISVATNAVIEGVPEVSAGNLLGSSLVVFLLIIPLLAVMGGGIQINNALSRKNLLFLLAIVGLPSLLLLDGHVSQSDGLLMIFLYLMLLYAVQKQRMNVDRVVQDVEKELLHKRHATLIDVGKILIAAALIFVAGRMLVDESLYFSTLLSIPSSLVGLILLSVGTNAPELVITLRCIMGRHKDIAFGDYMGSAAANTPTMGFLVLAHGPFTFEMSEAIPTFILMVIGLSLFYLYSGTNHDISKREGIGMLLLYIAFLAMQLINVARFIG